MLKNDDLILILSDMEHQGEVDNKEIQKYLRSLVSNLNSIDINALKFINKNRPLDISSFYDKLRKDYNKSKSKLYINIVKENPDEVITTLSAFVLQAFIYSKKLSDDIMFLKHSRVGEITKVLTKYCQDYDLSSCLNILHLIKADLKCFESIR